VSLLSNPAIFLAASQVTEAAQKSGNHGCWENCNLQDQRTSVYTEALKSELFVAHIDANPFGVKINLEQVLSDSLAKVGQSNG